MKGTFVSKAYTPKTLVVSKVLLDSNRALLPQNNKATFLKLPIGKGMRSVQQKVYLQRETSFIGSIQPARKCCTEEVNYYFWRVLVNEMVTYRISHALAFSRFCANTAVNECFQHMPSLEWEISLDFQPFLVLLNQLMTWVFQWKKILADYLPTQWSKLSNQ